VKRLLVIAGVVVLVTLLGSCGAGYAIHAAGPGNGASVVVAGIRDVSVMFLSLFWVITTVLVAGIGFGGAWAIGRFGGKAVTGVSWVRAKVRRVEGLVESGLERVLIRPLAKTARALASGKAFVSASMEGTERAAAAGRAGSDAALRTVSSLARQLRNNPLGQAER
jgi:hypothetical protein